MPPLASSLALPLLLRRTLRSFIRLLSLCLASLLLVATLVSGLDGKARNEPAHTGLILTVLGILAGANRLSQWGATLEDQEVADDSKTSPLEIVFGAVAVPEVQGQPEGLLGGEVGVAGKRPETADDESALQILRAELVLVRLGDACVLVVFAFSLVEVPLLLVGEVFDDNQRQCTAREEQVGDAEWLRILDLREKDEVVCWRSDTKEQQRLGQGDENDVEEEKEEAVVDLRAHDLPAVVFRSDLVPTLTPIIVCQANLRGVSGGTSKRMGKEKGNIR